MWEPKRIKWVLGLVLVVTIVLFVSGCGGQDEDETIIASYKGGEVTEGEFNKFLKIDNPNYAERVEADPSFKETSLKQYIAVKVISEQADPDLVKAQQKIANEEFAQMKQNYINSGGKKEWDKLLEEMDISEKDIKKYLGKFKVVDAVLGKNIGETEIKSEYELRKAENAFELVEVSHILISLQGETGEMVRTMDEALEIAEEVKGKLDQGEDFAELAKEYSDDPGSATKGGSIPERNVNGYVEEFKRASIELPIGQISDPVQTEFGFHVIRVDSRRTQPFEELDEQMKTLLRTSLISFQLTEYIEKELPDLITQINL